MPKEVVYCIMYSDYQRVTLKEIYRYKHDAEDAVKKHDEALPERVKHEFRYHYITERNLY